VARRARLILSGVPQHLIQRGKNWQATFFAEEDYRCYLDWLLEAASASRTRLNAN
jgi:putative transposase